MEIRHSRSGHAQDRPGVCERLVGLRGFDQDARVSNQFTEFDNKGRASDVEVDFDVDRLIEGS